MFLCKTIWELNGFRNPKKQWSPQNEMPTKYFGKSKNIEEVIFLVQKQFGECMGWTLRLHHQIAVSIAGTLNEHNKSQRNAMN